jgi:hypothetical protein
MKKLYSLFIIGTIVATSFNASAQCTPDPNCIDVLNPGEICPEILPDGTVGVTYSQTVTIIPPATSGTPPNQITLYKIKLKSVTGIPPGLTYATNNANNEFALYNGCTAISNPKYCILISGTPTTPGTYPLSITIAPYVYQVAGSMCIGVYPGIGNSADVVDDTSLAIIIHPVGTGYSIVNLNKFSVLDCKPNPFSYSSKIGYISPTSSEVKLSIFDVVGNLIYKESMIAVKGENYFDFDGVKLSKGMYIYSITNGKELITKQLIKN